MQVDHFNYVSASPKYLLMSEVPLPPAPSFILLQVLSLEFKIAYYSSSWKKS